MTSTTRSVFSTLPALALLGTLLLAACGAPPVTKAPVEAPPPPPSLERFQLQLGDGFALDYQIERTISKLNGRSCFASISGTLRNRSGQTLSKQSVLDFIVMSRGKQLFRDLSNPVSDIAPGGQAGFVMVVSPLHMDGCPPYDRINVSLRKVVLN
jgi:hypothetical protein